MIFVEVVYGNFFSFAELYEKFASDICMRFFWGLSKLGQFINRALSLTNKAFLQDWLVQERFLFTKFVFCLSGISFYYIPVHLSLRVL